MCKLRICTAGQDKNCSVTYRMGFTWMIIKSADTHWENELFNIFLLKNKYSNTP
jgi:hypothetical protein